MRIFIQPSSRLDSDEHSNSDESEKAKQMVKKEVNIKTVQIDKHRRQHSSTGLDLNMTHDAFQTVIDLY